MAVAGNAIHAYRCWLEDTRLRMIPMSTLRDLCDAPQEAVRIIRAGGVATNADSDVDSVRMAFSREVQR